MLYEPRGESDYPVLVEEGAGSPQRNSSWAEWTLKDKKKLTKVPWLQEHAPFIQQSLSIYVCSSLCWPLGYSREEDTRALFLRSSQCRDRHLILITVGGKT